MGKFNTIPGNAPSSGSTAVSTDLYPSLTPDTTYIAALPTVDTIGFASRSRIVSGFDGNGDSIALPASITDQIEYFDSSGNTVTDGSWAAGGIAPADVNAAADNWIGFRLGTNGLIYFIAVDTATSPRTYYTATVNQAGTISAIGNDQPSADPASNPLWVDPFAAGCSNIYRESESSGNLFIRSYRAVEDITLEAEINISTGAFVSSFAQVAVGSVHYKASSTLYVGGFSSSSAGAFSSIILSGAQSHTTLTVPYSTGAPSSSVATGMFPMQWDGRIVFATLVSSSSGPRACRVSTFNSWVLSLATAGGVK